MSLFETTIRNLGGLISAFDLSQDAAFLEKADDLGRRLMRAFNTAHGVPYGELEHSFLRNSSIHHFLTVQFFYR